MITQEWHPSVWERIGMTNFGEFELIGDYGKWEGESEELN